MTELLKLSSLPQTNCMWSLRLTQDSRQEVLDPRPGTQVSQHSRVRIVGVWDLQQTAISLGQDTLGSGWTLLLAG